jgi:hypothetical protein
MFLSILEWVCLTFRVLNEVHLYRSVVNMMRRGGPGCGAGSLLGTWWGRDSLAIHRVSQLYFTSTNFEVLRNHNSMPPLS